MPTATSVFAGTCIKLLSGELGSGVDSGRIVGTRLLLEEVVRNYSAHEAGNGSTHDREMAETIGYLRSVTYRNRKETYET
jgi:hypothetical protein